MMTAVVGKIAGFRNATAGQARNSRQNCYCAVTSIVAAPLLRYSSRVDRSAMIDVVIGEPIKSLRLGAAIAQSRGRFVVAPIVSGSIMNECRRLRDGSAHGD